MLNINDISKKYEVKELSKSDAKNILNLQSSNPQYFKYCLPEPSIEKIVEDMRALPEGKSYNDKHYIGFFDKNILVAVMDIITNYPDESTVYIGFFIVNGDISEKGIGSEIIKEAVNVFKNCGYKKCRLAYMRENKQSEAFWSKCGFINIVANIEDERGKVVVLEKVF